jgi:hypothetical protein
MGEEFCTNASKCNILAYVKGWVLILKVKIISNWLNFLKSGGKGYSFLIKHFETLHIEIKNIHMFEQVKHNMEYHAGVAIYPNMSLLIFFIFFVGLEFGFLL